MESKRMLEIARKRRLAREAAALPSVAANAAVTHDAAAEAIKTSGHEEGPVTKKPRVEPSLAPVATHAGPLDEVSQRLADSSERDAETAIPDKRSIVDEPSGGESLAVLEQQKVVVTSDAGGDGSGETPANDGHVNPTTPVHSLILGVPSCSPDRCWDAADDIARTEGDRLDDHCVGGGDSHGSWEEEHDIEFFNPDGGVGVGQEETIHQATRGSDDVGRQLQSPRHVNDECLRETPTVEVAKAVEAGESSGRTPEATGHNAQAEVRDLLTPVDEVLPRGEASQKGVGETAEASGSAVEATSAMVSRVVRDVLAEELTGRLPVPEFGAKLRDSLEQSRKDHAAIEGLVKLVEDQRLVIDTLQKTQTAQEAIIAHLQNELARAHEGFDAHDQEIQQLRNDSATKEVVNALGRELSVNTDSTALVLKGIDSRLELMRELREKDNAAASSVSVSALAKAKVEGFQSACLSLAIRGYFPRQLLQQVSFTDLLRDKDEISWAVIDADSRRARNNYEHSRAASSLDAHYATPGSHAAAPTPGGHASTSEVPPATATGRGGGLSGGRGGATEANPKGGTGAGWSSSPRK